jgi:hypothetical protein
MRNSVGTSRAFSSARLIVVFVFCIALPSHAAPQGTNSSDIPAVKGGAGPCSADFVVTDASGKGIYDAQIRLQVKYGFMGLHRLDLTVGTNYEGKARLEGLPDKIKSPAEFNVSHGGQTKVLEYDPYDNCQSHQAVTLAESAAPAK